MAPPLSCRRSLSRQGIKGNEGESTLGRQIYRGACAGIPKNGLGTNVADKDRALRGPIRRNNIPE